jgi:hypothetical protein
MKTNRLFSLLLLSVAIVFLATGCTTPTRSFNKDFGENFPPQPNYAIDNVDSTHFKVRVFQGTPMPEQHAVCVNYMKDAASTIANAEGKRRGWQEWQLNYIQERDQGWMHVLVAVVIRTK